MHVYVYICIYISLCFYPIDAQRTKPIPIVYHSLLLSLVSTHQHICSEAKMMFCLQTAVPSCLWNHRSNALDYYQV